MQAGRLTAAVDPRRQCGLPPLLDAAVINRRDQRAGAVLWASTDFTDRLR
jgi:hypothetical protein